ncbi:hypothetical protein [Aquibacillus saliphilus]|uniref:hypothetical protein n=1 Tax=Aquibacillus saliphilus TaxID=1909422 RepID=UPI001CF0C2B3|nr:hypothetical protein [Aquibacillus saliphilus]
MKKSITIATIVLALVIVSGFIFVSNSNNNTTIRDLNDINKIDYQETFAQTANDFIVYFWQDSCKYCEEIEDDVIKYANDSNTALYIVDMLKTNNQQAWYNWETHHQKYDVVIGKLVDGEEKINDGIDIEDFQNETLVSWSFNTNQKNDIIATHNTPFANLEPQNAEEIEITGTPTMIRVINGQFDTYAVGVDGIKALLSVE